MNQIIIYLLIFSSISFILFYIYEDIINPLMISLLLFVTYLSLRVSFCYSKKMKFALSYFFVGAMFASYASAEIIYYLQGYFGIQKFPSFEDIGYGMFYVFGILFVLQHISYYSVKSTLQAKIISISGGLFLFFVYLFFSWNYDNLLEFSIATISMGLSALFLSITLFATITLQKSKRFKEWILYSIAIGIYALADLHYYVTENTSDFSYSDISNYGWFVTPILFIYILLRLNKKPDIPI